MAASHGRVAGQGHDGKEHVARHGPRPRGRMLRSPPTEGPHSGIWSSRSAVVRAVIPSAASDATAPAHQVRAPASVRVAANSRLDAMPAMAWPRRVQLERPRSRLSARLLKQALLRGEHEHETQNAKTQNKLFGTPGRRTNASAPNWAFDFNFTCPNLNFETSDKLEFEL